MEVADKFGKVADMWVEPADKCGKVDDKLFLVGERCWFYIKMVA
ncbi:hypothetical protein QE429_000401 [Bacillus sp. SORGH_AS 510]|nr:hypothetical protein [Bacillus sp. SORGH_AS_0510]MDQ1143574.1 hypothetical protein [Bacillus sp. SORGH_AS_0510]